MSRSRTVKKVSLETVKELSRKLPKDHPFRTVIELEDSQINADEYAIKLKSWLKLLDQKN